MKEYLRKKCWFGILQAYKLLEISEHLEYIHKFSKLDTPFSNITAEILSIKVRGENGIIGIAIVK